MTDPFLIGFLTTLLPDTVRRKLEKLADVLDSKWCKFLVVFLSISFGLLSFGAYEKYKVHEVSHSAVLITGTSSGIGRHAALELARRGYTVFAGVRKEADAKLLKTELKSELLVPVKIDVTSSESISAAFEVIDSYLEQRSPMQLIGLVNNAGISGKMPLEIVPMERVHRLFDVNVFGLLKVSQVAIPILRKSEGRIINIGSLAGLVTLPTSGIYSGKFPSAYFVDTY